MLLNSRYHPEDQGWEILWNLICLPGGAPAIPAGPALKLVQFMWRWKSKKTWWLWWRPVPQGGEREELTKTGFERLNEADDEGGTARDLFQHLRHLWNTRVIKLVKWLILLKWICRECKCWKILGEAKGGSTNCVWFPYNCTILIIQESMQCHSFNISQLFDICQFFKNLIHLKALIFYHIFHFEESSMMSKKIVSTS